MKPIKPTKYNYLYMIVCDVTARFYYGIHSTNNLNDGYMGTGKRVLLSLKKHGRQNHTKTILEYFSTREEASLAEEKLVTKDLLLDPLCMNLQTGGDSNISFSEETLKKLKKTDAQRAAISTFRKGKPTFVTPEQRQKQSEKVSGAGNGMFGVKRPEQWCSEQSKRQAERYASGNHPLANRPSAVKGRRWFHNPTTGETRLLAEQVDGWKPGRG